MFFRSIFNELLTKAGFGTRWFKILGPGCSGTGATGTHRDPEGVPEDDIPHFMAFQLLTNLIGHAKFNHDFRVNRKKNWVDEWLISYVDGKMGWQPEKIGISLYPMVIHNMFIDLSMSTWFCVRWSRGRCIPILGDGHEFINVDIHNYIHICIIIYI